MLSIIGWFASLCFAICGAPQAYLCIKNGHGQGISKAFMWIWLSGELSMIPYILVKYGFDKPLITNLVLNTFFILIILKYIYFPRKILN